jgi:hypothetical protein
MINKNQRKKKIKNRKATRFTAGILAFLMFASSNGSFLVWGWSQGQLNFLGESKVAQAKIVETAEAITVEEILQESKENSYSGKSIFSDAKTEIVAREVLGNETGDAFDEETYWDIQNAKPGFFKKLWANFMGVFSEDLKTAILEDIGKQDEKGTNKPNAYDPNSGKPLVIAIIDTGSNNIVSNEQYNIVKPYVLEDNDYTDSPDLVVNKNIRDISKLKHGTKMEDVMVLRDPDMRQSIRKGNIKIVVIKVSDTEEASFSDNILVSGINKAKNIGANVISLSLGGVDNKKTSDVIDATKQLTDAGAVIFAAAGNHADLLKGMGKEIVTYMIENPKIVIVGAIAKDGSKIATYSSGVNSSDVDIYASELIDDGGTSAATAVVAGEMAMRIVDGKIIDTGNNGIDADDMQKYLHSEIIKDTTKKIIGVDTATYISALNKGWKEGNYDINLNLLKSVDNNGVKPSLFGIMDNPAAIAEKFKKYEESNIIKDLNSEQILLADDIAHGRSISISKADSPEERQQKRDIFSKAFLLKYSNDFYGVNVRRFDGDSVGEYAFFKDNPKKEDELIRITQDELYSMSDADFTKFTQALDDPSVIEKLGEYIGVVGEKKRIIEKHKVFLSDIKHKAVKMLANGKKAVYTNNQEWVIQEAGLDGIYHRRQPDLSEAEELRVEGIGIIQDQNNKRINAAQQAAKLRAIEKEKSWLTSGWDKFTSWFGRDDKVEWTDKEIATFDRYGETIMGIGDEGVKTDVEKMRQDMIKEVASNNYLDRLTIEFNGDKEKATKFRQYRLESLKDAEKKNV